MDNSKPLEDGEEILVGDFFFRLNGEKVVLTERDFDIFHTFTYSKKVIFNKKENLQVYRTMKKGKEK